MNLVTKVDTHITLDGIASFCVLCANVLLEKHPALPSQVEKVRPDKGFRCEGCDEAISPENVRRTGGMTESHDDPIPDDEMPEDPDGWKKIQDRYDRHVGGF